MPPIDPFLLFDDARPGGGPARLYERPLKIVAARSLEQVRPALESIGRLVDDGLHAAGFLTYEAGFALDPALAGHCRMPGGPLLWFGLFDGFRSVAPHALAASDPAGAWIGRPRPRISRNAYLDSARKVRDHLFAGDFYQANLTFGCDVPIHGPPPAVFARLRALAQAGWGGIVRHEEGWILSLSPEQFFAIRDGIITARPMKGTAPRREDPAADRDERIALAADPKQRAENLMIVDLLRNDLARVAETGSVEVPELFAVETYPTVHQMVSQVTARLRDGITAIDVLETIFPCGSITGAPKISAMQKLAALEPEPRGAYTGAMGWIAPDGDAAFNVLIRTIECRTGATFARLGLGSGLVVDSRGEDEWAECLLKGEFVGRAAETPDLIETMRFEPRDGIVALDRHLERLAAAARALDFRLDQHAARNELQAATFGHKAPAIARLLLSPAGTLAIEVRPLEPIAETPVAVAIAELPVAADDYRLRFKTSDRGFYDQARAESGCFEVLFTDPDGFLTEGSFTNIFVERDGTLVTPPASRPLLGGVLRGQLIADGKAVEGDLRPDDLGDAFFIGNSVRGLIPARLA